MRERENEVAHLLIRRMKLRPPLLDPRDWANCLRIVGHLSVWENLDKLFMSLALSTLA